jgi:hypothetical protein
MVETCQLCQPWNCQNVIIDHKKAREKFKDNDYRDRVYKPIEECVIYQKDEKEPIDKV